MRRGLFAFIFLTVTLAAAPAVELADGLRYFKVRDLDRDYRDVQAALADGGALVLDLRSTSGDLRIVWLEKQLSASTAEKPRYVLVNGDSVEALRQALPFALRNVISLAPAGAHTEADVQVEVEVSLDQRAVRALAEGSAPRLHLPPTPVKRRDDEAALARSHALAEPTPTPTPAPSSEVFVNDPVLARAYHLYRAWKAQTP